MSKNHLEDAHGQLGLAIGHLIQAGQQLGHAGLGVLNLKVGCITDTIIELDKALVEQMK